MRLRISYGGVFMLAVSTLCFFQSTRAAEKSTPIDTIVVTASPLNKNADELAVPVTVMNRDEILKTGGTSLGAVLANQPGITQSSFAPGASRPIIRGLSNARVRIQENGVGAGDVSALSEDHGVPIDPLSARQIEVVRGPATLRYGSEAIGGVVNVINNRIPKTRLDHAVEAESFSGFSTVNNGFESGVLLDGMVGNIGLHLDAINRETDNYKIPGKPDRQALTGTQALGAAFGSSYVFDLGYAGASLAYFSSDYDIPAPGDPSRPTTIDMKQIKANVASAYSPHGAIIDTIRFDGGYSDYTHDEIESGTIIGSTFNNTLWEGRLEILHGDIGNLSGALGVQYQNRDLSASGEGGELLAPTQLEAIAFFVFEELSISDRLIFQTGGRVEYADYSGTAFDSGSITEFSASPSYTLVSGSASLVFDMGWDIKFGTSVQAVQRAPDLIELFAKGPHESTATFEIGNANLSKEKAYSAELSLRRKTGQMTFDIAAFYTAFDGFIFKRFTGLRCGDDFASCGVEDELTQIIYSQQDAAFYGVELTTSWKAFELAGGDFGVEGRFDFVRAKLDKGGNLPQITPRRYGAGLFYDRGALQGAINLLRIGRQDKVSAFETSTKGYLQLNANATYRLAVGERGYVDLGITATNLLAEDGRNHVSFKKADVLQPGRDLRFTLTWRY